MTKCSYDMLNQVCLLRSQGNHLKGIAEIVGIRRETIYQWLKKGKKARIGKYAKFYNDWQKATEDYYKINPPKNTYKPKHGRENIPGYSRFKKKVLARDKVCVCCGYDDNLEVHHLYGAKENPELATDVNNGVVLCRFCHLKYHQIYSRYNINPQDFDEFMNRFQVTKEVYANEHNITKWRY